MHFTVNPDYEQSMNRLYIDPPWDYKSKRTGGNMKSGAAQQYETLTNDELMAMEIPELMQRDSIAYVWVPPTILLQTDPSPLDVLKEWKIKPKSTIYWIKNAAPNTGRIGTGAWWRQEVEILIFGIRGKVPAFKIPERNYFFEERRAHSQKPEYVWHYVEAHSDRYTNRIELFCRGEPRAGWYGWGNECVGKHAIKVFQETLL